MALHINTQPRLYVEGISEPHNEDAKARVARLKNLQNRIARRPERYQRALQSLEDSDIADTLGLHDEEVTVRNVGSSAVDSLVEYFVKRDETQLEPDEASAQEMFESGLTSRDRMERYIGRVVTWNAQQAESRERQAAG